jgi:hypothetical protein
MEQPGEQCTVVFALIVTCVWGGGGCPPALAGSVTIHAKTTVHWSPDSYISPPQSHVNSSRIHGSLTGRQSQLRHRVVVPASQATWLAGRYVNPMPESTLSPSQGFINSATGALHPTPSPTLKAPSNDKRGSFLNKF